MCPQRDLEIIDLTASTTKGKLMEEMVNIIMLQVTAALTEYFRNMMMRVVCSSSYEEEASKSLSLLDQEQSSVTFPA